MISCNLFFYFSLINYFEIIIFLSSLLSATLKRCEQNMFKLLFLININYIRSKYHCAHPHLNTLHIQRSVYLIYLQCRDRQSMQDVGSLHNLHNHCIVCPDILCNATYYTCSLTTVM